MKRGSGRKIASPLGVGEGWLVVADADLTKPWDDKISTADVLEDGKVIHLVRC